jgi:zinc protease
MNIRFFCIALLIAVVPFVTAQETPLDLSQKLPVDPNITVGTFDNGLRYYIRQNTRPENRAELRLVVNAGSVLEDEDQLGLAHFIEHMAFNGTKNFEKHEIVDYLESIGMRFGPDINAYTSFDETVYMLQLPTDDPDIVAKGFHILEEWASNIAFQEDEIEKERGVIIEEWRLGRGADARMRDKQFPVLFHDSRYAERLPIGKKNIIETAPPEIFHRFYRNWYRPDLMAVIAIGDFDKTWIKSLIEEHFAKLKNPAQPRKRQLYPVPDHQKTLVSVASDEEATQTTVSVYYKHDIRDESTVGAYRRLILEALYQNMFDACSFG